jgi:competence protein ComEC
MDPLAARGRIVGEPDVIARAFWSERLESVRDGIRHRLEESLTGGASGVARALVLGDGGAVDEMRRDVVRGAGLAHVLAVSGLHVAIAVGLLVFGLGAVLRRIEPLAARVHTDRIANALGVPIALLYAEVAGGAPSARRAALTAALAFLCHALGRRASPIPLAMAAIGILAAATPDRLLDPGLALSVVATLSVVTARAATDGTVRSFLWAAATVSARATLATAPIVWWCFGSVPLVAVMANVVLAPLAATLLIPLSLLHTLVSFVLSPFAVFTASAFEVVEGGFTGACALVSAVSVGRDLPPPTLAQGLVACAGTLAALMLARRRALVALVVTGALLLGLEAHVWHAERGDGVLRVTFLDVGQGDAIAIDMPDGETMVIDGGGGGARPGLRALLPLLEARRRRRVDVVVVSHPHPDHYEGIGDLIDALEVGELWVTGQAAVEEPDGDAAALSARAALSGAHIARPETLCGAPRRFGGAVVRVIAPCPRYDPGYDPNDNSLVLSLRYGERTFLFTGDAEAHEESLLVASGGVRADVLKVGHHGSRTSSGAVFLDAVRPALSVISAGIENRYGHPHPEVYERLARRGRVLSTAKDGGVEVITNGQGLTVRPYHGPSFALDLYSARQPTK